MKIPKTDSISELAAFWDTHDVTDFETELVEVSTPVFGRRDAGVVVALRPHELQSVRQLAESRGLDEAELIRGWILEKLPR